MYETVLAQDSSGGIMSHVQTLIKPPEEEISSKTLTKKQSHPYYRQPGRGHNHDRCDACDEGGSLICCDRCPASFHLGCHDPPLYEDTIPIGLWVCHTCRATEKRAKIINSDAIKIEYNLDEQRTNDNNAEPTLTKSNVRNLRRHSLRRDSIYNAIEKQNKDKTDQKIKVENMDVEHPKQLSSLDTLIEAASILNPKQFELPPEMIVPVQFPGCDKIEPNMKNLKRLNRNINKTKHHELDSQGLVPLPAKTCFYCAKSCKKAPLVACDYCPLFFHQDCLDPPLTVLPTALWMCPNHPENFIDFKLVTSNALTERIKLWNRFTGPVDQESVKTEFFRKVHNKNPPFRVKIKANPRDRAEIPPMILYHYENPPTLLPSLRHVLRCENVYKRENIHKLNSEIDMDIIYNDLKEIEQSNRIIVKTENSDSDDDNDNKMYQNINIENTCKNVGKLKKPIKRTRKTAVFEELREQELEMKRRKIDDTNQRIDKELKSLDTPIIKMLAFQRLQQILMENSKVVNKYQNETATTAMQEILLPTINTNMPLPSELLTKEDINRIARQFTCDETIDSRSPSPKKELPMKTEIEKCKDIADVIRQPLLASKIKARAVIIPVDDILKGNRWFTNTSMTTDGVIYMRYRIINIGSGPNCDIQLTTFGQCSNLSKHHAVIFFDEVTQNFELLNYSEYGTEVNGQLYSCNFKEYKKPPRTVKPNAEKLKCYEDIKSIIDERRGIRRHIIQFNTDAKMAAPIRSICKCYENMPLMEGWEGTAILHHGTLLRFGCISFVFSIINAEPIE